MSEEEKRPGRLNAIILVAFGFSGAAALIYEVAWIRSLSNVLGSATYAVSTMLSAFMAGLALGGYLGGAAGGRSKNPILLFGIMEAGIGIFGLLTIPAINSVSPIYFLVYDKFHLKPEIFYSLQFVICFLIMAVPTTLMGSTFPVVTRIVSGNRENVSEGVGRAYSVNTLGALAGSFTAGFVLIPMLGLKGTVQLAAGINIVVAVIAISRSKSLRKYFYGGLALFLITLANAAAVKSEPRIFQYNFYIANRFNDFVEFTTKARDYKILFHRDDPFGTVQVYFIKKANLLVLQNGGRLEAATGGDMENMLLLSYLPLAAKPNAKSLLGIGLGSGITMRAAALRVRDVTVVEINPSVVTASSHYFYPEVFGSGVNVVVDDARNYLQTTNKKFDIITSQPSYPVEPGPAHLFTREFYKTAAARLKPGGVMCQWFPYHLYSDESIKVFVKTFHNSFPYISGWKATLTGDIFLLGSKKPFNKNHYENVYRNVFKMTELPEAIKFKLWKTQDMIDVMIAKSKHLPYNTDDKPILEFLGAKGYLVPVVRAPGDEYRSSWMEELQNAPNIRKKK